MENIWHNEDTVRKITNTYKKHSQEILDTFIERAKALNLNPFNKEIYLIDNGQIMIGRDGYRKVAQSNPDYDYHQYDAVYQNDDFKIVNGEIHHSYNLKDRGKLVAAYCIAKRKGSSKAVYVYIELKEYNNGRNQWSGKPATMICKVAEGHCLRSTFNSLFAGTYAEGEMDELQHTENENSGTKNIGADKLKQAINLPANNKINDEQLAYISSLIIETECPQDKIFKALDVYNAKSLDEITEKQAQHFTSMLEKLKAS